MKRAVEFNDNELRQVKKDHQTTSQTITRRRNSRRQTKNSIALKKYYKIRKTKHKIYGFL